MPLVRQLVGKLCTDGMIDDIYGHVCGRHGGQFVRRGMKVLSELGVRRRVRLGSHWFAENPPF